VSAETQTDELMGLTPVVLVSVGDTIATGTGWHTVKTIGHASGRRLHITCTDGTSWLCPMHASTYLRGAA
jgi:hypothetical protein